jgi:glycosyltransferase involved in cell wall biosynthesis
MSKSYLKADHLRVCIVAFMFWPLVGGAEAQAEKHARQLQALGHDVMVITLRHGKQWKRAETVDGLSIVRIGGIYNRAGRLWIGKLGQVPSKIALFFLLWHLRHQYDVIHVGQLGLAEIAILTGKLTRTPVIVNIPTTGPGKQQEEASLMADTLSLDKAFLRLDVKDAVVGDLASVAQSSFVGRRILNLLRESDAYYQLLSHRSYAYMSSHGFRADHLIHIPNGVDIEQFQPNPQYRPCPENPERAIVCVARLQYAKGIDVLLHAWGRMIHASSNSHDSLKPRLLLVGEGPLRAKFERIATELGIQDSVEFLGLRRDVVELLQHAWGFVLPSRWEGMPNALLEAMACGLPCVASRVSGSEDIITNGRNGLLVEPEDPAELAEALWRIIEDSSLAQQLAQEGRATIVREYQLAAIAEQCLALYRRLLKKDQVAVPVAVKGMR